MAETTTPVTPMAMDSGWNQLINSTTANDLACKKARVLALDCNTLIHDALKTLATNNIISAPVIDSNVNHFIGFVDVLDIAAYAWHVYRQQSPNYWNGVFQFNETFTASSFFSTAIKEVINFSWWNQVVTVKETDNIAGVVDAFVRRYYKPHRVGLISPEGKFTNVLTQTDLIQFADENMEILPMGDKTIGELGIARPPILIPVASSMIDAINVLVANRVSGLGLIDQRGKLAANFSASDLTGMVPNTFNTLNEPALTYLSLGRFLAPVTCTYGSTLADVIVMLARERVHRVYVVEQDRPVGVISMSDIIPLLAKTTQMLSS